MTYLVVVSVLWAFSFGLIKRYLVGIDPLAVTVVRLAISLVAFLPWLRPRRLTPGLRVRCLLWGGVQFGLMYALYIAAFRELSAAAVAVLTVVTPLYVALLADARARRWSARRLGAALLAVAGAAIVAWRGDGSASAWRGALLVQGSNLCFAAGQLAFRGLAARDQPTGRRPVDAPAEITLTAWMYLGATLLSGVLAAIWTDTARLAPLGAPAAWLTLLYLGLVPTALGFHLWNKGAARAPVGLLAAANNLKVPLGVLAAWLVFGEQTARLRTGIGLAIILAALAFARGEVAPGDGVARRSLARRWSDSRPARRRWR